MSHKSTASSNGPIARLITHLKLMRDEKSCVIPLSQTEFETLIVARGEFKLIHSSGRVADPLSENGVAIVDSLMYHLQDYYSIFK